MILGGIASISSILTNSLGTIFSEYPKYEIRLMNIFEKIANSLNLELGKSLIQNLWGILQVRDFIQKEAVDLSSSIVSSVRAVFVFLLLFTFFLIELGSFSKKIHISFEENSRGAILNISRQIIFDVIPNPQSPFNK